ncbi:hypothetical protein O5559_26720, partial [Escherichia coli]|nr:hypothetical protein [Escherichia coli]
PRRERKPRPTTPRRKEGAERKPRAHAQVMAIFFIIIPQITSLPTGSSLYSLFQANNQLE